MEESVFNEPPRLRDRLFGKWIRQWKAYKLKSRLPRKIKEKSEAEKGFWSSVKSFFVSIWRWIKKVVLNGILSFFRDILGFFRNEPLERNRDVPFIANANSPLLANAFEGKSEKRIGLFQGVYDDNSDELSSCEYIEADALDRQTQSLLEDNTIVVLS